MCVCVCVCDAERKTEREKERERKKERERERERETFMVLAHCQFEAVSTTCANLQVKNQVRGVVIVDRRIDGPTPMIL